MRAAGRRAIARGLTWERTRILASGEVRSAGNTRANGVMVVHNGPKLVVYPMVADARVRPVVRPQVMG